MLKLLHFADAHIDMANYGSIDPETGLAYRVLDFLKSLDTIVDTALSEKVDLVVFSGDAYRDRSPAPTFIREWDKRVARLSKAGVQTVLLVGNHDIAPSALRAHALQEMETLEIPNVHVASKVSLYKPEDLGGLPLNLIALPWFTRAKIAEALANTPATERSKEEILVADLQDYFDEVLSGVDPDLPLVLAAHAAIEGADYGLGRLLTVGADLTLPVSFVKDPRFDYVALGHIHKFQDMNSNGYPPVVYPGSIERVDFGESKEEKGFVMVSLEKGKTTYEFRQLATRKFISAEAELEEGDAVMDKLVRSLPSPHEAENAITRLIIYYPRSVETQIDEAELKRRMSTAFDFKIIKKPEIVNRARLGSEAEVSSKTPIELVEMFWQQENKSQDEISALKPLAAEIIDEANHGLR